MAEPATQRLSYAQYLAMERESAVRHEFVSGVALAMAGGSIDHGRLIAQLGYLLRQKLEGRPCVVLSSDARVRIRAADRASYPDLLIACGTIERDPDDEHAVINPIVVIEVLSGSTASYDREQKGMAYRKLRSLTEYVLVSQGEVLVERYRRKGPRSWTLDDLGPGEPLALESVGVSVAIDDIYRDALGPIVEVG